LIEILRTVIVNRTKKSVCRETPTNAQILCLMSILAGRSGRRKSPKKTQLESNFYRVKLKKKELPAPVQEPEATSIDGFDDLFEPESDVPELAKVAVSILTWPIAQLSKTDRFKPHEIVKVTRNRDATTAIHHVVTPDPELGMPTMLSLRILFLVLKEASSILAKTGSIPRYVPLGTGNQICKALGLIACNANRRRINLHLQILHSTCITSKRAFKTHKNREGISDKFFLIPSLQLKGKNDVADCPNDQIYVALSDPLRECLENNYVKTLDLTLMAEVQTDIAQLLYTKISYLLQNAAKAGKQEATVQYNWLVESMGLTEHTALWRAKQQLNPALKQLVKLKYIKKPKWKDWEIVIKPDARFSFGEKLQLDLRKEKVAKTPKKRKTKTRNPQQLSLPIMTQPADALYGLCSLYAQNGWQMAQKHAKRHNIETEEQLRIETLKRDIEICFSA